MFIILIFNYYLYLINAFDFDFLMIGNFHDLIYYTINLIIYVIRIIQLKNYTLLLILISFFSFFVAGTDNTVCNKFYIF
jgi:hypothetical protein